MKTSDEYVDAMEREVKPSVGEPPSKRPKYRKPNAALVLAMNGPFWADLLASLAKGGQDRSGAARDEYGSRTYRQPDENA